ncbi:MAG: carboxy terminal-processing peptidase, partial [Gammaproteobacteria bacterium]|nr:carboxy terminal-processing peptidase [Gammaproteobacteria bacterium]
HRGLGRIYDMFDSPLGSVQYTIAKFYRINGGSTQHKGVIPDILFPTAIDPQEWGESKEEYALPWDSINAAHYDSLYDIGTLVPSLREKHQARINAEPEFQYLLEDIKEYKQNADDKIVSLKEAERVAERDDSKAQQLSRVNQRLQRLGMPTVDSLDDVPEKLEKIDPFLEEAANITADLKMVSRLAKK